MGKKGLAESETGEARARPSKAKVGGGDAQICFFMKSRNLLPETCQWAHSKCACWSSLTACKALSIPT